MDSANDVLFSEKQRGYGLEDPTAKPTRLTDDVGLKALNRRATSGEGSSLLRRSVKGLVLGGLAASWGCSLSGLENSAGKAADVARFSGGFTAGDVGLVPAGGATKAGDMKAVESMSSCVEGLLVGGMGVLLVQNPLPLLVGLGECLPKANAQQRIGGEFQVNTYTASSQSNPSVASFNNGNFVVAWHSNGQDGSAFGIYGQLFDENATKVGPESQVNTYTQYSQRNPSLASFSNGNFVVIWQSENQDGSNHGIYGQLFYGNGTSALSKKLF